MTDYTSGCVAYHPAGSSGCASFFFLQAYYSSQFL
jgi:hypothetical protein